MNSLQQILTDCGADLLPVVTLHPELWRDLCADQQELFGKACHAKPDTSPQQHLLGLLTKRHIECSSHFEQSAQSETAVKSVFEQTLGHEQAGKFQSQTLSELLLVTHLWLYLQGYLNMDFSLANDHAQQTAERIAARITLDAQAARVEFMQSYYAGKECSPQPSKPNLFDRLKAWFNPDRE
ncbi:hypothetical protein [Vibrio proteolyticus]